MSRYVMQSVITYKLKFILVKVKEIMSRLCNGHGVTLSGKYFPLEIWYIKA